MHDLFDSAPGPHGLTRWGARDWPVAPDWRAVTDPFWDSTVGQQLAAFVRSRLAAGAVVYPPLPMSVLACTPRSAVRVVILGQDPYHGPGQAEGLAFSVPTGVRPPPSLRNIFKEIERSLGQRRTAVSLRSWAEQGVLLLNTCLTVEDGLPASHAGQGWEVLTSQLVQTVAQQAEPCVFMLWGAHAQRFSPQIDAQRHLVLTANHPSPLSATRGPQPFIGCDHFRRANAWLVENSRQPVDWLV